MFTFKSLFEGAKKYLKLKNFGGEKEKK